MPEIKNKKAALSLVKRYIRMQHSPTSTCTQDRRQSIRYFYRLWKAWPEWADNCPIIAAKYKAAKYLTNLFGIQMSVDHIIPLKSDLVCGLHVHYNLAVISKSDNERKSNKWWPDHPFENLDLFGEQ